MTVKTRIIIDHDYFRSSEERVLFSIDESRFERCRVKTCPTALNCCSNAALLHGIEKKRYARRARSFHYVLSFVVVWCRNQPHKRSPLHSYNTREVADCPNQPSSIRFDSIRFILDSTRFDSTYFFKIWIRFDSIRLSRIESNRIIRQFDSLSVSGSYSCLR